jgi:hypothetical protein
MYTERDCPAVTAGRHVFIAVRALKIARNSSESYTCRIFPAHNIDCDTPALIRLGVHRCHGDTACSLELASPFKGLLIDR